MAEKLRGLTLVQTAAGSPDYTSEFLHVYSEDPLPSFRWKLWLGIVLVTLLLHLLFFLTKVNWLAPLSAPPIEVQQVDPKKLEAIKKSWANQNKQLLINKDHSKESASEAPKDARYMSDRNIHVDKEQRAKNTVVVPAPGSQAQTNEQKEQQKPAPKSQPQTQSATLPKLGNLGVPFRLNEKPKPKQDSQQDKPFEAPQRAGGEQYVDDKSLPQGSENLLNAEESVYYSFYARLYQAIGPIWSSRLREIAPGTRVQPGDYTSAVDVVLDAEGNLVEVRLLQASGVREFDEAVNTSWKKVGRFPNPPKGLLSKDGNVHTGWNFTVQVGKGTGFNFMPPERTY